MKTSKRDWLLPLSIVSICLMSLCYAVHDKAQAADHIPPAYTAPQEQASELAVPSPQAAPPASLVVVTRCNQIVGIVAADTEGNLHPLSLEGLGDGKLKSIISRIAQRVVVDTGCPAEPDKQPIF